MSLITLPFESVTETSIWIRLVEILTTSLSGVGVGLADGFAVWPKTLAANKSKTEMAGIYFFIYLITGAIEAPSLFDDLKLDKLHCCFLLILSVIVGNNDLHDIVAKDHLATQVQRSRMTQCVGIH